MTLELQRVPLKKLLSDRATILVIDDDPLILKILQDQLSFNGFRILVANNGRQAIQIAGRQTIDLAICDMHMPIMNGLEVTHYFKDYFSTIPVIMLTVQNDPDSVVAAMKAGAFDYLTKPMNKETLLLTVQKGLRHQKYLKRTQRLEMENKQYKNRLESMVFEKTAEIERKNEKYKFLLENLKSAHLDTVQILSEILMSQDPYRTNDCEKVHRLVSKIGHQMCLSKQELEYLSYATYLRDIGEIFISSHILNKTSRLTTEEYKQIREHPIISENLLKKVSFFKPILPIVRAHHEWYNGTGYPDGIKGKAIPLLARIIHVADAFIAMISHRAYRRAMPSAQAILNIKRNAGTQFCPQVVDAFLKLKDDKL